MQSLIGLGSLNRAGISLERWCYQGGVTHFIGCTWMKRKLRPRCISPEITASKRYRQKNPNATVPNNPENSKELSKEPFIKCHRTPVEFADDISRKVVYIK